MIFTIHFICSFIATMGFAIYFNISRKILFWVGLIGSIGWVINFYFELKDINTSLNFFVSSLIVAFLAEFLAIKTKNPSTVFSIPGIYPLVPGYTLYMTMRYFTINDISKGMETLVDALTKAGSIALGIIVISTISSLRKKIISNRIKNINKL